jgi:hypothetical protein
MSAAEQAWAATAPSDSFGASTAALPAAADALSATTAATTTHLPPIQLQHHQRPATAGIASVPKESQLTWRSISSRPAFQYRGSTFLSTLRQHLPTSLAEGHAEGPQRLARGTAGCLPDAEHRQAWSTHPTFRWFKRSDYTAVADRWCARDGPRGRGDSTYRPLSVAEQAAINARVARRLATRGEPRRGEW